MFTGYTDDARRPGGGEFLFRNSFGPKWGKDGYGAMSFAYAQRYANDALWLERESPQSEVPAVRYEAEEMPVLASQRCSASPQNMKPWGGLMWSHGRQLFCGAQRGGFVDLGFSVPKGGRYRLRVLATAAPDFGIVRAAHRWRALACGVRPLRRSRLPGGKPRIGHVRNAGRPAPAARLGRGQECRLAGVRVRVRRAGPVIAGEVRPCSVLALTKGQLEDYVSVC